MQALMKAGKTDETADNYVLIEEIHRETDKTGSSQRVLSQSENVLHAQSRWKGSGRFLLRKKSGGVSRVDGLKFILHHARWCMVDSITIQCVQQKTPCRQTAGYCN
jgi:hypothetical protein